MNELLSQIESAVLPRSEVSTAQREEMFHLLATHFHGVTPEQFSADLEEKNWIILIKREGRVVGFSTLLAEEQCFEGEPVSVIYSGDTIVSTEARGTTALARSWITSVNELRENYPRGRYYWLLLTSGFRTYRFLPVFWREFYPRFDRSTPYAVQQLLDHLARARYGTQYRNGMVRFAHPQCLRGEDGTIPNGRLADPHIAFFTSQNPGHRYGDELVCLTELTEENLTSAGRRMVALPQ